MPFWVWLGSIEEGLVYGLMALGIFITFRILSLPDLTVDGTFPLGAAVAASLITAGVSPAAATAAALAAGCAGGLVTGLLHTKLRITGLLAGILTMSALYSANLRIMGRSNVPLLRQPTVFRQLEEAGVPYEYVELVGVGVVVVLALAFLNWFLRTEVGHALRATGDNEQMIRSLGVNTDTMKVLGLAMANGLVALSGALLAQAQGYADAGMGIGMIISGLASVIIGEALLRPKGIFTAAVAAVAGSIAYRLAVLVALRSGFAPTDLKIVTALLVVLALAAPAIKDQVSAYRRRRGARSEPVGEPVREVSPSHASVASRPEDV